MNNLSDEQLVASFRRGDCRALEFLIQKYLGSIYNFVYGYAKNTADAEDITQEVFVKVWKKIKKYNPEYKFKTWLYTIAKNTALDWLKKKKVLPFSALGQDGEDNNFAAGVVIEQPILAETLDNENDARMLNKSIEELPESYRATLDLRYRQGLKFREIASLLEEPIDTVKTRHRRALSLLKRLIS